MADFEILGSDAEETDATTQETNAGASASPAIGGSTGIANTSQASPVPGAAAAAPIAGASTPIRQVPNAGTSPAASAVPNADAQRSYVQPMAATSQPAATTPQPAATTPQTQPTQARPAVQSAATTPQAQPTQVRPAVQPTQVVPPAQPTQAVPAAQPTQVRPAAQPTSTTPQNQPTQVRPAVQSAPLTPQVGSTTPATAGTVAARPAATGAAAPAATASQPTQVRPAVQTAAPAPQPAAAQPQPTATHRPAASVSGSASGAARAPRFSQDKVRIARPKRSIGMLGAFFLSLFTALLGAGILYGALVLTGQIVAPAPLSQFAERFGISLASKEENSAEPVTGQAITINATSDEAGVAQAVAAKALPSVVSFYVVGQTGEGLGSGVVLDTDGNILTNYHVVEGATSITATIEGNAYDAQIVGSDPSSDLAVVKADLDGAQVTPIEIGNSSDLVVGDWVMTIGSPYGLDQSVSSGIVSSLYRSTMMTSYSGTTLYTNLIQTDAAINPGNSGGALVNNKGELVGINSLNASSSGSSSGVGFAIPVNYAIKVANTIIAGDPVQHAYIGVYLQTVTAQNAQQAGLSVNQGAYVARVSAGTPAAEAGLEQGDVIIKLGRDNIASADALILAVRSHDVGETVQATVVRDGKEMTVDITMGSDLVKDGAGSEEDQSQDNRESIGSNQGRRMLGALDA